MKAAFTPGSTFAGYRIESLVGRGGMGVVYRATDLSLERPVALKLVAPELAEDERFRTRFLREPRLAASLDHPNVIPIYEAGEHDGQLYLAMRFVEGSDLKTLLEREGKLPPERALRILGQVAGALDAAQRRALVHRDVKPANVLLDEDDHAYLTDFGITKQLGGASTDTGRVVGTLDYLAPEQIRGDPVDGRTDSYALGCVLYECLSGDPPFRRDTEAETLWAHMQEEPPPLKGHAALDPVLRKALAKDREDRYGTCAELIDAAAEALGLGVPRPARRARSLSSPRTRAGMILAGGLLLLAAALAAAIAALTGDAGPPGEPAEPPGARAFDPRTGAQIASIPLGSAPSTIAVGEGAVWVVDADDRTISRIDSSGRSRVRTFSTASTPTAIGVGAGAVWVGNAFRHGGFAGTSYPQSVTRLDPETGDIEATIELPRPSGHPYFQGGGFNKQQLAVTEDAVWVVNTDQTISRIDPRTNRVVARVRDIRADDLAAGPGGLWATAAVSADADGVVRIDPRTNEVAQRVEIAAESLTAPAVGAGGVWVADPAGGSVWRVDPSPEPLLRQITLDVGVRSLAFGRGALWATNEVANKVYRIDPRTNRARVVGRTVAPQRVAVGADAVWVTALGPPSERETLPASACGELVSGGGGRPELLIASDLPLQGDTRPFTAPMVDGIRSVLEDRGFRAGQFHVGYQSCDASTAQAGGTDIFRCLANGTAYARTLKVVGVIGSFHSFCSELQIPTLNRAPEGPLAMISPSNTIIGLTRPYAGMRRGELARLYPSGERNFFRIAAADHLTPLALVEAALQLGRERVYVLWDRDDEDTPAAGAAVQREVTQRGLELAGARGWSSQARDFAGLARDVAAARPDALLMLGAAPPRQDALIGDLRHSLGRQVAVIASDGFMGLTFEDLPVARGMYVANYGIPNSHLPRAGRSFLERFARSRPGGSGPDAGAAYTAQATEILLDAIARSDGTRRSVTRELRRTRVEDGILGDIRFDRYGDLVEGPFTIYRVTRGGGVVDRVVRVSVASG